MTADLTKLRAELRAGLDGVTPGPWSYVPHFFSNGDIKRRSICVERSKYDWIDLITDVSDEADATHIARCSPENVRALLDALDAAERERDEARATLERVRTVLASTDIVSLPDDYPTERMAADRIDRIKELTLDGLAEIGRREAAERERDEALRQLNETHIEENGTVWHRPTAYSYYAVCTAVQQARRERDEALRHADVALRRADVAEAQVKGWQDQVYLVDPFPPLRALPDTAFDDPVPAIPAVRPDRLVDLLDRTKKAERERDDAVTREAEQSKAATATRLHYSAALADLEPELEQLRRERDEAREALATARRDALEEAARLVRAAWLTCPYGEIADADAMDAVCVHAANGILDLKDRTP